MMQVELKTTADTPDAGYLQKAADFIHAYILGESQTRSHRRSVAQMAAFITFKKNANL
jgi:hypothetical protein